MLLHLLHTLYVLAALVAGQMGMSAEQTSAAAEAAAAPQESTAVPREATLSKEGLIAAVLTETPQPFRLSNTRSQRALSSHGAKPFRPGGKQNAFYKFSNHLHNGFGRFLRREAQPFPARVPRTYYVLALGRLLC
ncbi:MAG: hypothetical protein IJ659_05365 [Alloprevotella sp.]|nr:hypothetical protein [Alloprevotella sp.]